MKPNPPDPPPPGDDAFLSELRRFVLRPPPAEWREEILAAARSWPVVHKPWHRSPFWRGMAALWVVSIVLWADTPRLAPATHAVAETSPDSSDEQMRALLAELEHSPRRPHNIFAPLP